MATVPEAVPQDPIRRYSNAAVTIHWLTAALVVAQVILGFAFAELLPDGPTSDMVFTWHTTIGATILLLALVRLGYRLKNPPPPFPPDLPKWRRYVAVWNHRLFYFVLIVLPLTGLLAVSGMAKGPTTKRWIAFSIRPRTARCSCACCATCMACTPNRTTGSVPCAVPIAS